MAENTEDEEYLNILYKNLKILNQNKYDFIFYVAGVDIHFEDRLGKLKITDTGVNKRDQIVIENFNRRSIPLCGVLGGGYNKNFNKLIELHSMLHKNCAKVIFQILKRRTFFAVIRSRFNHLLFQTKN